MHWAFSSFRVQISNNKEIIIITEHELPFDKRVHQSCGNNYKVNLDRFKWFVFQFVYENGKQKTNESIKHSKQISVKLENSSQLFEFRFSYWNKNKLQTNKNKLEHVIEGPMWIYPFHL